jgi:hypothetical protein
LSVRVPNLSNVFAFLETLETRVLLRRLGDPRDVRELLGVQHGVHLPLGVVPRAPLQHVRVHRRRSQRGGRAPLHGDRGGVHGDGADVRGRAGGRAQPQDLALERAEDLPVVQPRLDAELVSEHRAVVGDEHGEVQRGDGVVAERVRVLRQAQPEPHPPRHAVGGEQLVGGARDVRHELFLADRRALVPAVDQRRGGRRRGSDL